MRMILDACVLFPTVMREMLIGAADRGLYTPLWSERIIEEWVRATARLGEGADVIARGEAALMRATYPGAMVTVSSDLSGALPDSGDDHVLAAAVDGAASGIVTRNTRDFPLRVLGVHGVGRSDPDDFLLALWQEDQGAITAIAKQMHKKAETVSGRSQDMRGLLKRAGMPRLGKAIAARGAD